MKEELKFTPVQWSVSEEGTLDLFVSPVCYFDLSGYEGEAERERVLVNACWIAAMPMMYGLLDAMRNGIVPDPCTAASKLLAEIESDVESRLRRRRRRIRRV